MRFRGVYSWFLTSIENYIAYFHHRSFHILNVAKNILNILILVAILNTQKLCRINSTKSHIYLHFLKVDIRISSLSTHEDSATFYNMHTCTTCCFRSLTVSSRWLQLVATPVKYNRNSIENISTLSYRVTVVLIANKLDVGLSHITFRSNLLTISEILWSQAF